MYILLKKSKKSNNLKNGNLIFNLFCEWCMIMKFKCVK